ncbi:hypothetical protein ACHQM5_021023 [Ranunculus cassubicifolius]
MGKKMKLLPSLLFKNNPTPSSSSSFTWQWPSCKQPRTHSFRVGGEEIMFKTVNSVYFDGGETITTPTTTTTRTPESSWFTNSSESASFSTVSEDSAGESVETVIKGLRSERLFFEPGDSNSILEKQVKVVSGFLPFKESVVLAMESDDPYVDFRASMEEMVEAHGVQDWDYLEELLAWYLKVNGKKNHGFIVGAFVDLLVGLAATSSPCFCSLEKDEEGGNKKDSCLEI